MLLRLLPLILGVLLIAAGLWLVWRRARESGDDWAIGCMACGFPASEMRSPTSFVCPGCGGDVRISGLAPRLLRSKRRRLHPLLRVGLFSSVFSLGAAILIHGPWFRTDGTQLSRYTVNLAPPSDSPGLRSAEMVVDVTRADKRIAGYASVSLVTDTGLATMEVTLPDRTAMLVGDAGPIGQPEPMTAETFDALARHAGLDPADQLVRDQLEAIRDHFRPMAETGQPDGTSTAGRGGRPLFGSTSSSGGGSGTAGSPAVRPARWAFAGLAACWLAGVAFLLRPDRTALRTSPAPIVAAPVTPTPAANGGVA